MTSRASPWQPAQRCDARGCARPEAAPPRWRDDVLSCRARQARPSVCCSKFEKYTMNLARARHWFAQYMTLTRQVALLSLVRVVALGFILTRVLEKQIVDSSVHDASQRGTTRSAIRPATRSFARSAGAWSGT